MAAVRISPCGYINDSMKFGTAATRADGIQYNQVYYTRLHQMKQSLQTAAERKWG